MLPFLKEVAEDVISKHRNNLMKICFVFPNKRTKMFFRKYYSEVLGETSISPTMITIRQLIQNFTKLNEIDKLSLIFDLFQILKKVDVEKKVSANYNFDTFYKLGEIIINDFNEIDSWLIPPKEIFRNIKEISEIETSYEWLDDEQKELLKSFWQNFAPEKQSKEKEKFIQLWNILPQIYDELTSKLLNDNTAYNGLAFRYLSNLIDEEKIETGKFGKYIFIGYNALNKAEEKLFNYLKNRGEAEFYWDTDKYYHFDYKQEAGDFLRKNFKNLNITDYKFPDNFNNPNKKIDLIGVPLEVGQAKLIPSILENYEVDENGIETAVVLANEKLLFSVLHSLPEQIETVNVTMGYPLSSTSLFNFVKQYLDLHQKAILSKSKTYNYKNVISIIKHPDIWEYNPIIAQEIIDEIETKNMVQVEPKYLLEKDSTLYPYIFSVLPDENTQDISLSNLLNILFLLFDKRKDENQNPIQTLENEYIYKAYVRIKRYREVLQTRNINISFKLSAYLLTQILSEEQIPFEGDAVEGLQLMGVLETRNIDFKNLIILGVNEGYFPSVSRSASFISESLRNAFDMPLVKYQDSVFAYLFYRLLQRAENVTLVYNSIVNDSNSGEISRFIKQIEYESNLKINHKQFGEDLVSATKKAIRVEKNAEIMHKLQKYEVKDGRAEKRLSASAINAYIDCSLKFYFRYIAKITKPDVVEEEISQASFGTILHDSLEFLYTEITRNKAIKTVEKQDFKQLYKQIDNAVLFAFNNYYSEQNSDFVFEGNTIIIKEVIKKYIKTVLRFDEKYAPFEIISLEDKYGFQSEIEIEIEGNKKQIGIRGIIDRVDKKDGIYRVIDYKTGISDKEFKGVSELFDVELPRRKKQILQTFLYTYLFKDKHAPVEISAVPAIFDVRKMNLPYFNPFLELKVEKKKAKLDVNTYNFLLPEFLSELNSVLINLFNEESSFCQSESSTPCRWCDFATICSR